MPYPTFCEAMVEDLEAMVSSWENNDQPINCSVEEHDFFCGLRNALDTYYAEVARR